MPEDRVQIRATDGRGGDPHVDLASRAIGQVNGIHGDRAVVEDCRLRRARHGTGGIRPHRGAIVGMFVHAQATFVVDVTAMLNKLLCLYWVVENCQAFERATKVPSSRVSVHQV